MTTFSKYILVPLTDILLFVTKSISIFITIMVMYYMLGSFNTQTIALIVFLFAGAIFSAAFISAMIKDRVQRRKTSQLTVFES